MVDQLPTVSEGDRDGDVAELEALVRRLVTHVAGEMGSAADQGVGWANPVILDLEVDGVRCRLVRAPQALTLLSPREREIAVMVARGCPNRMIAAALDISSWTVASHLRRVFCKLRVSSRAAMVARLLEDELTMNSDVGTRKLRTIGISLMHELAGLPRRLSGDSQPRHDPEDPVRHWLHSLADRVLRLLLETDIEIRPRGRENWLSCPYI